jgi:hypothetical protein
MVLVGKPGASRVPVQLPATLAGAVGVGSIGDAGGEGTCGSEAGEEVPPLQLPHSTTTVNHSIQHRAPRIAGRL